MDGGNDINKQKLKYEFKDAAGGGYSNLPPFDPSEYQEYVQDFDLTEDQKNELLRTLWSIMAAFVDMGFGVASIQQVLPALAQISSDCESNQVKEDISADSFNEAAKDEKPEGGHSP